MAKALTEIVIETANREKILSNRYQGVYYRDSTDPNKIFNGKPDRAFYINYRDENGTARFPCVGWLSTGHSERLAYNDRLAKLGEVAQRKKNKQNQANGQPSALSNELTTSPGVKPEELTAPNMLPEPQAEIAIIFNELAEKYFSWLRGENKYDDKERNRYDTNIRDVIGWVPHTWIDKLIARDFKADLIRRMSNKHAKACLSLCRSIINHANESEYINYTNPFGRASGLKMPRCIKCERYLEPWEVDIFLKELNRRSYQVWAMSFVSLRTGLRATEIFKLKGTDLVPAAGFFWVTAKGGERQKVFCDNEVMDLLLSYKRKRNEYIFQAQNGTPLKEIPDVFRRCAEDLGLSPKTTVWADGREVRIKRTKEEKEEHQRIKVWFHTLRHTYASWLAQSGKVTLHELRDLMRHTSIEQTERYAHMIPNHSNREHSGAISAIWVNYEQSKGDKAAAEDKAKLDALKVIENPAFQKALESLGPNATAQDAEVILAMLKEQLLCQAV